MAISFVEFIAFYTILQWPSQKQNADLIAVFNGANDRIVKGFELSNDNIAPFLMISPASNAELNLFDKLYRRNDDYQYLIERNAKTTFQNALIVSDMMKQNNKKSVVVVTSDYHMPRSYLLLKMQLAGTGKIILPYAVNSIPYETNPLKWSSSQRKKILIEMVDLWGSFFELIQYKIQGHLPKKPLSDHKLISFIRRCIYNIIYRFL
jgi:hypothetical protein